MAKKRLTKNPARAKHNAFIRDFFQKVDERMKDACVDALNEAAENVVKGMFKVFSAGRVVSRTNTLQSELANYKKAKKTSGKTGDRLISAAIKTEDKTLVDPGAHLISPYNKQRGRRNDTRRNHHKKAATGTKPSKMKGRYPVSYGRLIEFSPRLNQNHERDFFYGPWYEMKASVREQIVKKIREGWAKAYD